MTIPTTRLLQWNLDFNWEKCDADIAKLRVELLADMIAEHSPGLVLLQEAGLKYADSLDEVLLGFQTERHGGLLTAFSKSEWAACGAATSAPRALCVGLKHQRYGAEVWVWNVHFPAPTYAYGREDPEANTRKSLVRVFDRVRLDDERRSEIVAGDFNCQPYDPLLLGGDFLCANRCLSWVRSQQDTVTAPDRVLYNPCWSVLSSLSLPMGTYYRTGTMHGPWLVFDQVLLSAIHAIEDGNQVQVLTQVKNKPLLSKLVHKPDRGKASDHLPLLTTLAMGGVRQ